MTVLNKPALWSHCVDKSCDTVCPVKCVCVFAGWPVIISGPELQHKWPNLTVLPVSLTIKHHQRQIHYRQLLKMTDLMVVICRVWWNKETAKIDTLTVSLNGCVYGQQSLHSEQIIYLHKNDHKMQNATNMQWSMLSQNDFKMFQD